MLPFAAILAIAAIGQTLVIQQRGPRPVGAGDDHADDDHRHEVSERRREQAAGAIGLVVLACVASGTSAASRSPSSGSRRSSRRSGDALLTGAVLQITSGTANVSHGRGWTASRGEDGRHPEHGADRRRCVLSRRCRDQEDRARPAVRRRGRKPGRRAGGRHPGARLRGRHVHRRRPRLRRRRHPDRRVPADAGHRDRQTTTCCRRSRPSSWAARRSRAAEAA